MFNALEVRLMMYHGLLPNVFDLKEEDINVEVIIGGATRINRFLGQTRYAYPVAAHLIGGYWYLCEAGASELTKKQWLIHEAFESYTGVDLPSPLKAVLPAYKEAEKRALRVIAKKFGVDPAESEEVKALDRGIMLAEAIALMPNREYWEGFAKEQGIIRLPNEHNYVVQSCFCNEVSLRKSLETIWTEVFGELR